jgi:hypothetical protein
MFEVHYVREIFYLLAVLTTLKVVSGVLFDETGLARPVMHCNGSEFMDP